jgi:hypothetical protein
MVIRKSRDLEFKKHRHDDPAAPYCLAQEQIMRNAAEAESRANKIKESLHSPNQDIFYESDLEHRFSDDEEGDEENDENDWED